MYSYERKPRKSVDLVFSDVSKKLEFENKLESLKQIFDTKSKTELFLQMMDLALMKTTKFETPAASEKMDIDTEMTKRQFEPNEMFLCTLSQIQELLDLQSKIGKLSIYHMEKLGHVCQLTLIPTETVPSYVFWNSSPNMNGDFYINYKMFHAYCCSGILQVQYERLCDFAGI